MPISEEVLDVLAVFLLDLPQPCPGDAKIAGRDVAALMTTQKLLRHKQVVERMKEWELLYQRVMLDYWRGRAIEAENRLTRAGYDIEQIRSLNIQARSRILAIIRGLGGWEEDVDELTLVNVWNDARHRPQHLRPSEDGL